MIKLKDLLFEGKWSFKGKFLNMPTGEISSIPAERTDRDAIIVKIKTDKFQIYSSKNEIVFRGNKYDKTFKNANQLIRWLNKNKAEYVGIENR